MRVQCDVCANEVASAFCCADEAALCATCDVRVHTANKLAAKHPRFSLVHPISSDALAPRCDVCQVLLTYIRTYVYNIYVSTVATLGKLCSLRVPVYVCVGKEGVTVLPTR